MKKSNLLQRSMSFKPDSTSTQIVADAMKSRGLCQAEAIRFIIVRYDELSQLLKRAGVKVVETKPRVDLEFPR